MTEREIDTFVTEFLYTERTSNEKFQSVRHVIDVTPRHSFTRSFLAFVVVVLLLTLFISFELLFEKSEDIIVWIVEYLFYTEDCIVRFSVFSYEKIEQLFVLSNGCFFWFYTFLYFCTFTVRLILVLYDSIDLLNDSYRNIFFDSIFTTVTWWKCAECFIDTVCQFQFSMYHIELIFEFI